MTQPKFYITTAIDYVNSVPHLGTAYEKILADAIARYKRRNGFNTFFLMGTDEHSQNVERQAMLEGIPPKEYCDRMVDKFKKAWSMLDISFDNFIRTTEERHITAVRYFIDTMYKNGDIYKGWYKGFYCTSCEAFLLDGDLIQGKCPTHEIKPQWIEEENHYFRLSKYEKLLLKHIEENQEFITPEIRRNEILNIIKGGLKDISISRSTVGWGIPVPFDTRQVIYVWVDALINYLSGIGFPGGKEQFNLYWPCDLHVVGKDITRFHCIIWPAMLLSAGLPLPKTVFGHGFVYLGGEKMSKTRGTVVDPVEIVEKFGSDPIRYFLLREVPYDRDGEFTWDRFKNKYQSDLSNDLGNLVHRVLNMVYQYNKGKVYCASRVDNKFITDLVKETARTIEEYKNYMNLYKLSQALSCVWSLIGIANRYVEETSPWVLNKQKKIDLLNHVLYNLTECIRIIALLIEPFMPKTAIRIWFQLGFSGEYLTKSFAEISQWGIMKDGHSVGRAEPIFPSPEE